MLFGRVKIRGSKKLTFDRGPAKNRAVIDRGAVPAFQPELRLALGDGDPGRHGDLLEDVGIAPAQRHLMVHQAGYRVAPVQAGQAGRAVLDVAGAAHFTPIAGGRQSGRRGWVVGIQGGRVQTRTG